MNQSPRLRIAASLALVLVAFAPNAAAAQAASPQTAPPPPPPPPPPVGPPSADFDIFAPAPAAPAPAAPGGMDALKGKQVGLIVAGREVSGLVTAVDGDFVTLVDRDMKLVMVPKAQITEIRAARDNGAASPARSSRPARTEIPPTGGGLYAGGILLTIFGAASLVSGMTFVFITPEDPILWATQAPPGLVMLTAGIPMTVEGARRRNLYRRALYERLGRLSPTVSRTAGGGWTGGITLRF